MPVIRDIPLTLNNWEVLRWQGFREHSKIRPVIKDLVTELLAGVKRARLIDASAAYEIHPVTGGGRRQMPRTGKAVVKGLSLPEFLKEATYLAAAVCTIGPGLEKQVSDCFRRNEPLRGALLDGIGSAAVISLAHEVCKLITGEASSLGYQVSGAFSPGMAGVPISEQRRLLELAEAEKIGVSLTTSGIMVPCKSTSMIIGIGPQIPEQARSEACVRCSLKNTCLYRMHTEVK